MTYSPISAVFANKSSEIRTDFGRRASRLIEP
jgi:hypothetical protein